MEGESKVFVGGLPPQTTQESLASYLSQYGQITECKVVLDLATGRSKGYGFVVYSTPQEAQAAVAEGYLTVDGKKCNCNLASVGAKKDAQAMNKKRSFDGSGGDMYSGITTGSSYEGYDYSGYPVAGAFDKRQRTDMSGHGGYMMPGVTAGVDMSQQSYQNYQMHMTSSFTVMYNDLQSIKYEMTNLSQSIAPIKSTLTAMKNGIDALCAKQGIVVPQHQPSTTYQ